MDSGLTIRPIDVAAPTPVAPASPAPAAQAVATDLGPSKAVTASADAAPARNDVRPAPPSKSATRVDIAFDKRTHAVVLRIVNAQTGKLIVQVPQQAHTDFTV